jgi:hypothetical protein
VICRLSMKFYLFVVLFLSSVCFEIRNLIVPAAGGVRVEACGVFWWVLEDPGLSVVLGVLPGLFAEDGIVDESACVWFSKGDLSWQLLVHSGVLRLILDQLI